MRTASQDYTIIINEEGDKFLGIALGYDYCAEHEWGIDDIKRRFGIPESSKKNMGVASRSITKNISNLIFKKETYKKKKFAILYTGYQYWHEGEDNPMPRDLEHYKKNIDWRMEYDAKHPSEHRGKKYPMITAWDDSGFGVAVMGEKEAQWLEELYEAFNNVNVVIAMINHRAYNPFAGTSLSLMIKDRLPKEVANMMYSADKQYFDRKDYEKKTGIPKLKEKMEKARQKDAKKSGSWDENLYGHNHGYYIACSPKWIDYDNAENREKLKAEMNTKYDIMYWVNYSDNDDTHDHFTVEEIREWLTSKKKLNEIRKTN
jgi:hypothetical protein